MAQNSKGFFIIEKIVLTAMMVAMSVVIGIFCKSALNFGAGLFRITFENLPIILTGILFGPVFGGVAGLLSDVLSYLLSGQAQPPLILVTIGAISIGVVSGLISKLLVKKRGSLQIIASGGIAHVIGSMIIKPIGLFQFYGWAVLLRIPFYCVIAPIEIFLLCLLFKNGGFRRMIHNIDCAFKNKS